MSFIFLATGAINVWWRRNVHIVLEDICKKIITLNPYSESHSWTEISLSDLPKKWATFQQSNPIDDNYFNLLIIFYICFHFIAFTQAANLRNHERIHSQVRPYVCGDCGKAFTQITNLNVSTERNIRNSDDCWIQWFEVCLLQLLNLPIIAEPSSITYRRTAICLYRTRMWSVLRTSKNSTV